MAAQGGAEICWTAETAKSQGIAEAPKAARAKEVLDLFREIRRYVKAAVAAIVIALGLCLSFQLSEVSGNSMSPAINHEDLVLLNHLAYISSEPKVGDIVIFKTEIHTISGEAGYLVKRVAGIAGDKVSTDKGSSQIVKEGYVYVLGDNREVSLDSRSEAIGQVPVEDILGRVDYRLLPLEDFGRIE